MAARGCTTAEPSPKRARHSAGEPWLAAGQEQQPSGGAGDSQHSLPSLRSFFLASAPVGAAPSGAAEDEEQLGPLTQLAAAGAAPLGAAFCAHCGAFLSDLGATEAEQRAHVDACAAAAPADGDASSDGASEAGEGEEQGEDEEGAPGEEEDEGGGCCYPAAAAAELEDGWGEPEPGPLLEDEGEPEEVILLEDGDEPGPGQPAPLPQPQPSSGGSSIQEWLAVRGLQKYADCFERAGGRLLIG